jgi:hypothetical protein
MKTLPPLQSKPYTDKDRIGLAIISLMRTFLGNYDQEKKVPKTIQRLMNRCENGMRNMNYLNTIAFKNTVDRVNKIYEDAINEFKDTDTHVDMVGVCIMLHTMEPKILNDKFFITEKDMGKFYIKENIDENGLTDNNRAMMMFFEDRLRKEFNVKKKELPSKFIEVARLARERKEKECLA